MGHTAKIMPAAYVKPYVKTNKNDVIGAEAICEAVRRPHMRFVPVKSEILQAVLMLHRARTMLTEQRLKIANAMRAFLSEFGIIVPVGKLGTREILQLAGGGVSRKIPELAQAALGFLANQYRQMVAQTNSWKS
jgi:transposase